jgi:hypothetical protein
MAYADLREGASKEANKIDNQTNESNLYGRHRERSDNVCQEESVRRYATHVRVTLPVEKQKYASKNRLGVISCKNKWENSVATCSKITQAQK